MQTDSTELTFERYPKTSQQSLQAWNAADELILSYCQEQELNLENVITANDTFGVLSLSVADYNPSVILTAKSQEKSIRLNAKNNNISLEKLNLLEPLFTLDKKADSAILKVPKSLDLFELFLQQISNNISDSGTVVCGFMTKYFTKGMLSIAEKYFENVSQTKALKKARLLLLKSPIKTESKELIHSISLNGFPDFKQHYGVFSASHIDYASQFLIENLTVKNDEIDVLDLASGNGVLSSAVLKQNPKSKLTLLDDSWLAMDSSKMNLPSSAQFLWDDNLDTLDKNSFDLVISNPPFHFGHETNIEVSLNLFKGVKRCLRPTGRFVLVANSHLNYKTHLSKLFKPVQTLQENDKFIIYECLP